MNSNWFFEKLTGRATMFSFNFMISLLHAPMDSLHKKFSFPLRIFQWMWSNPQKTVNKSSFAEEILNAKLHFLCSIPPYFPQHYLILKQKKFIYFKAKFNFINFRGIHFSAFLESLRKLQVGDKVLLMFSLLSFKIFQSIYPVFDLQKISASI